MVFTRHSLLDLSSSSSSSSISTSSSSGLQGADASLLDALINGDRDAANQAINDGANVHSKVHGDSLWAHVTMNLLPVKPKHRWTGKGLTDDSTVDMWPLQFLLDNGLDISKVPSVFGVTSYFPTIATWLYEHGDNPWATGESAHHNPSVPGIVHLARGAYLHDPLIQRSVVNKDRLKTLYLRIIKETMGHPFRPIEILDPTSRVRLSLPFIQVLSDSIPNALTDTLQCISGFHAPVRHDIVWKFNYAGRSKRGYHWLRSLEGRDAVVDILESRDKRLLSEPVIKVMMDSLWRGFARRCVVFEAIPEVVLLLLMCAMIHLQLDVSSGVSQARIGVAIAMVVFSAILLLMEVKDLLREGMASVVVGRQHWHLPAYLLELWNYVDIVGYSVALGMGLHYAMHEEAWNTTLRRIAAVETLFLFTKQLEFASGFRSTGRIIRIILAMSIAILKFIFINAWFLLMFSYAFYLCMEQSVRAHVTLGNSAMTLYRLNLGNFEYTDIQDYGGWLGEVLFVLYSLLSVIVLLNLLIALMLEAFENVNSDADAEFLVQRAGAISRQIRTRGRYATWTSIIHSIFVSKPHAPAEEGDGPQLFWTRLVDTLLFPSPQHHHHRHQHRSGTHASRTNKRIHFSTTLDAHSGPHVHRYHHKRWQHTVVYRQPVDKSAMSETRLLAEQVRILQRQVAALGLDADVPAAYAPVGTHIPDLDPHGSESDDDSDPEWDSASHTRVESTSSSADSSNSSSTSGGSDTDTNASSS